MLVSTFSLTNEGIEEYLNFGRESFLRWLCDEKHISEELYVELCKTTRIILKEPSKLSRFYKKYFKGKEEPAYFITVKFHDLGFKEETKEEEQLKEN